MQILTDRKLARLIEEARQLGISTGRVEHDEVASRKQASEYVLGMNAGKTQVVSEERFKFVTTLKDMFLGDPKNGVLADLLKYYDPQPPQPQGYLYPHQQAANSGYPFSGLWGALGNIR